MGDRTVDPANFRRRIARRRGVALPSAPPPGALELDGLIDAEWGQSDNKRRAKFYKLTDTGRKALADETDHWQQLTRAIALVMETV